MDSVGTDPVGVGDEFWSDPQTSGRIDLFDHRRLSRRYFGTLCDSVYEFEPYAIEQITAGSPDAPRCAVLVHGQVRRNDNYTVRMTAYFSQHASEDG